MFNQISIWHLSKHNHIHDTCDKKQVSISLTWWPEEMSHEVEQDQNVLSPHLYYLQLFSKQGVLQIPLDQMVPVQKENKNNKLEW